MKLYGVHAVERAGDSNEKAITEIKFEIDNPTNFHLYAYRSGSWLGQGYTRMQVTIDDVNVSKEYDTNTQQDATSWSFTYDSETGEGTINNSIGNKLQKGMHVIRVLHWGDAVVAGWPTLWIEI